MNCSHFLCRSTAEKDNLSYCYHHPKSVTAPKEINKEEALSYVCDNWVSKDNKLCRNCKYWRSQIENWCMNIKNAIVESDGNILPKNVDLNQEVCKYFVQREELK